MEIRDLTPQEKTERFRLAQEFMSSAFYVKYFAPHLEMLIYRADKLSSIDDKKIEMSYYQMRNKRDITRGILNKIKDWADSKKQSIKNSHEGGEKNA